MEDRALSQKSNLALEPQALLGETVRDRITNFTGVVTGVAVYISGCAQALVVPLVDKDGKLPDSQWFDARRLVPIGSGKIVLDNSETPGCDRPAPRR